MKKKTKKNIFMDILNYLKWNALATGVSLTSLLIGLKTGLDMSVAEATVIANSYITMYKSVTASDIFLNNTQCAMLGITPFFGPVGNAVGWYQKGIAEGAVVKSGLPLIGTGVNFVSPYIELVAISIFEGEGYRSTFQTVKEKGTSLRTWKRIGKSFAVADGMLVVAAILEGAELNEWKKTQPVSLYEKVPLPRFMWRVMK